MRFLIYNQWVAILERDSTLQQKREFVDPTLNSYLIEKNSPIAHLDELDLVLKKERRFMKLCSTSTVFTVGMLALGLVSSEAKLYGASSISYIGLFAGTVSSLVYSSKEEKMKKKRIDIENYLDSQPHLGSDFP